MSNKPKIYDITVTGSTTPRDIRDIFSDVVNVKDFGAKGDGVADDTEAIQAALNTGKTVYIPSGIYACYGELAMTIAGTRIVGAGMGGGYRGSLATPITNWTHNTTLLFKDNTRPSPAPKQGFAHNEESSHERGKEYRDQGSLFTYAPNGGEVEPQHHDREREHDRRDDRRDERRNDRYDDRRDWNQDRYSERSEHPFKELMGMVRPLIKDLRESYGKKNEYANEKGFDDIERIEDELEGWLGYRDLAKKDPRYKHVSKQEFGHMLLAIQDLLQYIYEETRENPEERQELYNFIHMIKG